ncbi:hypothetical protein LJK88_17490 [Paenibacillus sp. P26]|nr:hypothetical protein LJK88_17490 [Paenibacillus sp. P26]
MKKIWTIVLLSILLGFGTGIPAAKASSPALNVSFDPASGVVTITGQLDSAGGSPATVQVRNPLNSLDYLDQQARLPTGHSGSATR